MAAICAPYVSLARGETTSAIGDSLFEFVDFGSPLEGSPLGDASPGELLVMNTSW